MPATDYTHADMVTYAAKWLRRRHPVVITDIVHAGCETPDAIGFMAQGQVTLMEAKASRSDFLRDKKKYFRSEPDAGIGSARYYIAPDGVISVDDLPETWGLLTVKGARIYMGRESGVFQKHNTRGAQSILISMLRRIGGAAPAGVSVKCYTHRTKSTTTMSVEQEP